MVIIRSIYFRKFANKHVRVPGRRNIEWNAQFAPENSGQKVLAFCVRENYAVKFLMKNIMCHGSVMYPSIELGLRLIGLFPGATQIKGFLVILLIAVINIPFQVWNAIEAYGDIDRFMNNFGPTLVMLNFAIKLVAFRLSHRAVKYLVNEIIQDFMNSEKSNNHKVMAKNLKTSNSIYKLIAISYNTLIPWCIMVSVGSYYMTKSVEKTEYFIPVTYPYIAKNWENYGLVNVFLLFQMTVAANGHAIIEGLLALVVLHAATQVHIIRSAIKYYSEMCCNTTDKAKINAALRNLVFVHQKYLNFAVNVENAFTYIILSQLLIVTLQMCVVEYALLTMIESNAMTARGYMYLNLLIADLWGAAAYCAAGEYFITQSDYIYREFCQCPWYKFRIDDMKTMLMLFPKMQRPPVITYGKLGSLSLFFLMSILRASFSYLSVFRAIKAKQHRGIN